MPPYPCSRHPFHTTHTQCPLENAQYQLDLRRIPTPPREFPDVGAPTRPNQNQSQESQLMWPHVSYARFADRRGLPSVEPGCDEHQRDRSLSGGRQAENIEANLPRAGRRKATIRCRRSSSKKTSRARSDASHRETGEMPLRSRCALYRRPIESRLRLVLPRRANSGAMTRISPDYSHPLKQ